MSLHVTRVGSAGELALALAIRHQVFVVEQRVPLALERDGRDGEAEHVLGRRDGVPVATARLVLAGPQLAVAQRVAVLPAYRRGGTGAAVMAALEARARELGVRIMELHAQVPVRGFYERLGYTAHGPTYDEAGIPHVSMRKAI